MFESEQSEDLFKPVGLFNKNFKVRHLIGGSIAMAVYMYGVLLVFTALGG
jgi:hypothetical protein